MSTSAARIPEALRRLLLRGGALHPPRGRTARSLHARQRALASSPMPPARRACSRPTRGRGWELKVALVRAAIAGIEAIRAACPGCAHRQCRSALPCRAPPTNRDLAEEARDFNERLVFQAWDMLAGACCRNSAAAATISISWASTITGPTNGSGGRAPARRRDSPLGDDDPRRVKLTRPRARRLAALWRGLMITETSPCRRPAGPWLREVAAECRDAAAGGRAAPRRLPLPDPRHAGMACARGLDADGAVGSRLASLIRSGERVPHRPCSMPTADAHGWTNLHTTTSLKQREALDACRRRKRRRGVKRRRAAVRGRIAGQAAASAARTASSSLGAAIRGQVHRASSEHGGGRVGQRVVLEQPEGGRDDPSATVGPLDPRATGLWIQPTTSPAKTRAWKSRRLQPAMTKSGRTRSIVSSRRGPEGSARSGPARRNHAKDEAQSPRHRVPSRESTLTFCQCGKKGRGSSRSPATAGGSRPAGRGRRSPYL